MAFDPLHKWLGIPASEQPPNHYRLLGLAAYEEDRDVIDAAADIGEISAVARSGTVAVSRGEVTLTSFDRQHLLAG